LLRDLRALCQEIHACTAACNLGDLHHMQARAAYLLRQLQKNVDAEVDLIQESITTDIGAGD
jgi:hypothetical protein